MTLGEKIKKLRGEKGLTQKELADEVHVTFQTVSKWEKDENEPDVATLRELAKIFSCSIDYLLSQSDEEDKKDDAEVIPVVIPVKEEKTVVIHQKEAHVCEYCKKDIEEGDLEIDHIRTGSARHHTSRVAYYHKECLAKKRAERAEALAKQKKYQASRACKLCWGWSIPSGVVALLIVLFSLIANNFPVGQIILYSVLSGYGIFAAVYCILSGSYIGDVFVWAAGLSIKFPGIIFSWDLDGFAFLIIMKVLFAVLGFIIGVLALILAIGLSGVLAMVSFPFILIHNINNDYDDSLFN